MDRKKGTGRIISNTNNDAKIPELPLDVILNIISRFPVKLILKCKSLSKEFKNLISHPSFSHIYLTNKPNSCSSLLINCSKSPRTLDFFEFDEKGSQEIDKVSIFNLDKITRGRFSSDHNEFSISGCNGLFCLLRKQSNEYDIFITNPILSELIQLPEPVVHNVHSFVCGLGYCQFTNRYKVLRIFSNNSYRRGLDFREYAEIFSIGYDRKWSVMDVNVVFNTTDGYTNNVKQSPMVPLRSALHWFVEALDRGSRYFICAFDMTEEKATAFRLPPEVLVYRRYSALLSVVLEKLCVIQVSCLIEVWVMDEYGVEASWTKQFVIQLDCSRFNYSPLAISPEGVMVIRFCKYFIFNDMEEEWLRIVQQPKQCYYLSPFVLCFVSLRNLVNVDDVRPGICNRVC